MRTSIFLFALAAGTAGFAPAARACDGQAALPAASGSLPAGSGSHASGAPPRNGYREAPTVPISQLPTTSQLPSLPPTREFVNPATGYYAPGPAVGIDQRPVVRPAPRRVIYVDRYGRRYIRR